MNKSTYTSPIATVKDDAAIEKTVGVEATTGESVASSTPAEYGGPKGKEPTRYGDWEKNGRCIDF